MSSGAVFAAQSWHSSSNGFRCAASFLKMCSLSRSQPPLHFWVFQQYTDVNLRTKNRESPGMRLQLAAVYDN